MKNEFLAISLTLVGLFMVMFSSYFLIWIMGVLHFKQHLTIPFLFVIYLMAATHLMVGGGRFFEKYLSERKDVKRKIRNNRIYRMKCRRIIRAAENLRKSQVRLVKARAETRWISENPHIHVLNYPFYKLMRILRGWF